jgi:hypothetical protein
MQAPSVSAAANISGGNVTDVASNAERRIDVKKRAAYIPKQEHTHLGMPAVFI